MKIKLTKARLDHKAAYADLARLVDKYTGGMDAIEILAVAANLVGKLTAMQDQRQYTPEEILEIVSSNVKEGNAEVVAALRDAPVAGRA